MAKENKSMFVVLGILSIKPMSGYDIKSWIEEGVGFFWKINYNQIYPALKSFIQDGLATCSIDRRENRPERKVYSLTEKGLVILRKWLMERINQNHAYGNELLLKLFFGAQISPDDNLEHLLRYKNYLNLVSGHLQQIEKIINEETSPDQSRSYRKITLQHGLKDVMAKISWCEQAIADLNTLKLQNQQSEP